MPDVYVYVETEDAYRRLLALVVGVPAASVQTDPGGTAVLMNDPDAGVQWLHIIPRYPPPAKQS